MPVDEPTTVDGQDPGAALRAARDAAGLSVPEVAQRLKLTVRLVEAIEANDRQRFPPAVYLRGFVRNYAKVLGLDAGPLLEAYELERSVPLQGSDERPRSTPLSFLSPLSIGGYPPVAVISVAGGHAAVALVALVIWQRPLAEGPELSDAMEEASSIESAADAGEERTRAGTAAEEDVSSGVEAGAAQAVPEETVATPGGEPAAGGMGSSDAIGSPAAEPDGPASPTALSSEGVADGSAPDSMAVDAPVSGDGDLGDVLQTDDGGQFTGASGDLVSFSRLTPVGDEELLFEFTEDCWVEVFDTEGEILYQDLMRRRQSLRLVGAGPFQIRLGYAPAVTLAYNGEPVPLAPHTRNNVALLVVGQ